MKNKVARACMLIAVLAAFFLLLGWGTARKPVVTSEPIPCYTEGDRVICFDGEPAGDFVCEQADDTTVLCLAAR